MITRVLLADDQQWVRSALRLLLAQAAGLAVVAEAANATELLLAVAANKPDLLLLDWELPGLSAVPLLRRLQTGWPFLKIIAMSSRPDVVQPALRAGATAFLSKCDPPERVLAVIHGCRPSGGA